MTTAPGEHRGSVRETWRLLASDRTRHVVQWPLGLLIVVAMTHLPGMRFSFGLTLFAVTFWVFLPALFFEYTLADRLAFLTVVPQPIPPRRLVLAPLWAIAAFGSIAMVAGNGPAIAVLATFASACWVIGATRWLIRLRWWPLALPLVFLAPVASFAALRGGGWGAATAVAVVLGIAALRFQPRTLLDPAAARAAGGEVAVAQRPGFRQEAVSRAGSGRWAWLASAARFHSLMTAHLRPAHVFAYTVAAAAIATFHFPGCALFLLIICVPRAEVVGAAFSPEATEFVGPRPLSSGQRWAGGLLIPLLFTAGFSVLLLPCFSLDWINGGGLPGRLLRHPPFFTEPNIGFLRGLGATFLPEKWPAGGLSADVWPRLRPLLLLDLLRANLFMIAALFAVATLPIATGNRKQVPWPGMLTFLTILFSSMRIQMGDFTPRLPMPTWWFAGLLAIAAFAHWRHRVRRAHAEALTGGDVSPAVGLQ